MKTIFVAFLLLLPMTLQAACEALFTPIGIAVLTIKAPTGGSDGDATELWDRMLVPPQDSSMGPGKILHTAGKELKFICNQRPTGDLCMITISTRGPQSGRWVNVDVVNKKASFRMVGDEADDLSEKFKDVFASSEGKLQIHSRPGLFEILFSESGF